MMLSLQGIALMISDKPIFGYNESFLFMGKGSLLGAPFLIYIMLFVALISYYLLRHTRFGRYIYAIGGNVEAANVSGINIKRTLMTGYAYASTLAALAGVLLSSRIMTSQPTSGDGYEMDAIAGAVIGGTSLAGGVGTIWGTLVGALIIGVLNNALDLMLVNAYMQQVLKGAVIVGAVVLDTLRNRR
jgi:inositol transport system permease protein